MIILQSLFFYVLGLIVGYFIAKQKLKIQIRESEGK